MFLFQLDTRTVLLLLCLGNAITVGLFPVYAYSIKGDRFNWLFVLGKVFQSLSWGLILFKDHLPGFFSAQIAMNFMSVGIAVDAAALTSVRVAISKTIVFWIGIPALISALNIWIPSRFWPMASIIGGLTFVFPYLVASYLLMARARIPSGLATTLGCLLAFCYLGAAAPVIHRFLPNRYQLAFSPDAVMALSHLLFFLVMVVSTIGYILLKKENIDKERERIIAQLQEALQKVKTLKGLLPICCRCKKIRDDQGYWQHVETYVRDHTEADFSHGLCPECMSSLYGDLAQGITEPEQG